jgi:flagellar biosynthesis protein FlhA
MPKLTEDLVPGVVTLTTLHKVLQNLLAEKVPIRDMRTILETLAEHAPLQTDPYELTTVSRGAGPCDYPAMVPWQWRSAGYWS